MPFFTTIWEAILATSLIEWLAFSTSIIYVILAAKQLIICWLFGFIGCALYVYVCFTGNLYIESVLQSFYVVMAVVGWLTWKNSGTDDRITKWSINTHLLNIVISGIIAVIVGFFFETYTNQVSPYVDAFTTCYSLSATFMVTKKILGNWIYWIVIDLASIYLYAQQGYNLAAVQYLIFTILAVVGFIAWNTQYKTQKG